MSNEEKPAPLAGEAEAINLKMQDLAALGTGSLYALDPTGGTA